MKTFVWDIVNPTGDIPDPRDDHSATLAGDGSMIIFGGFVKGSRSNDLYAYDFTNNSWKCLDAGGNHDGIPCKRAASSLCAAGNQVYLFGGQGEDNNKMNDLWVFDLGSNQWKEISTPEEERPHTRTGHTALLMGDRIIIFGGILEVTKEVSDVFAFNVSTQKWELLDYPANIGNMTEI